MKTLSILAVLWTAVLIPLAFVVPVYSGETRSSGGGVTHDHATLVGVNGLWVAGLLCLPFGLALLAWLSLRYGWFRAAQVAAGVFMLFALVASASVGIYYVPPAALLFAAATTEYRRASRSRNDGS